MEDVPHPSPWRRGQAAPRGPGQCSHQEDSSCSLLFVPIQFFPPKTSTAGCRLALLTQTCLHSLSHGVRGGGGCGGRGGVGEAASASAKAGLPAGLPTPRSHGIPECIHVGHDLLVLPIQRALDSSAGGSLGISACVGQKGWPVVFRFLTSVRFCRGRIYLWWGGEKGLTPLSPSSSLPVLNAAAPKAEQAAPTAAQRQPPGWRPTEPTHAGARNTREMPDAESLRREQTARKRREASSETEFQR